MFPQTHTQTYIHTHRFLRMYVSTYIHTYIHRGGAAPQDPDVSTATYLLIGGEPAGCLPDTYYQRPQHLDEGDL